MVWFLNLDSKQGFFQQFREKAPGQNWEKIIVLTTNWEKSTTLNMTRVAKYILKINLF